MSASTMPDYPTCAFTSVEEPDTGFRQIRGEISPTHHVSSEHSLPKGTWSLTGDGPGC